MSVLRILSVEVPLVDYYDGDREWPLSDVTVYCSIDGRLEWADVRVTDLGDDYDVTTTRMGHHVPPWALGDLEEAAVAAYDAARLGGRTGLDAHNALLAEPAGAPGTPCDRCGVPTIGARCGDCVMAAVAP